VVSQFMLAVPLCLLYELGIVLARFVGRSPGAAQEGAVGGTGPESSETGPK
jgi:Sec-independent protein secretion pathway component TatC